MHEKIHFPPEPDAFYETLKKRVEIYFAVSKKSRYADFFFYLKAVFFISTYVLLYMNLLFSDNTAVAFVSMILMGPFAILIGINVAHDAAHGSISKHKAINGIVLFLFDLLGSNSYIWKRRHVYSHHSYPNILNNDADLKQNPLVRIFPGDELKPIHRYQFLYAPLLYLAYTINWLFVRDFQDFFAKQIGSLQFKGHSRKEIAKLVFFKLFYISYILVIPLTVSQLDAGMIFLAFLLMNFCASLLITLALIPSHVAEDSHFPLPDERGVMQHSWSHHQLLTIIDFATNNWFLNFLFGGFNHHVAHHLFPRICHVHYIHVTPVIKQTAAEFGLAYKHEDSFLHAYISHFRLLKNNGMAAAKHILE